MEACIDAETSPVCKYIETGARCGTTCVLTPLLSQSAMLVCLWKLFLEVVSGDRREWRCHRVKEATLEGNVCQFMIYCVYEFVLK